MSTPEQLQIEHDGVQMHCVIQGEGPPVLLVHGMPSSLNVWALIKDRLATRYRVIAMDLPGFGQSSKVALPTLKAYTGWLARLLDRVGEPSAHVVGQSFGGMISLALLYDYPERVRSLVLSDSVGLGPYEGGEMQRRFIAARTRDDVRAWVRLVVHDPACISDAVVDGQFAYLKQPDVPRVLEQLISLRPAWEAYVESRLDKVNLPLLVMWGRHDRMVPVSLADRLRHVPGARFVVFENCGHAPMVEQPQEFGTHLLDFLDDVTERTERRH